VAESLEPLDDLDEVFTLPDNVPEKWKGVYEVLVVRLRREAAMLSMSTINLLLIERIAYNYVVLRTKEAIPAGSQGAFSHATQQKEFNSFWLAMTQEFNRQTRQVDAQFRENTLKAVAKAVRSVLADIPDTDLRSQLTDRLAHEFEEVGL